MIDYYGLFIITAKLVNERTKNVPSSESRVAYTGPIQSCRAISCRVLNIYKIMT